MAAQKKKSSGARSRGSSRKKPAKKPVRREIGAGVCLFLALLTALRYGPAGVAGWAVKSVARRPLKMLLAVALEPLLSRLANRVTRGMK